ncbi:MAG: hypothetical protein NZ925_06240 [Sulfolobales archaeon]|nr:hypothetical protein [Sulfolobales archaeon]
MGSAVSGLHGRAVRVYFSVLVVLVVALSISVSVLYLQQRDTQALLRECRAALSTSRSEVEALRQYTQWLYANYTKLYEYAKSLLANYTELRESYIELGESYTVLKERYEAALSMLEATQRLYEELHSSHTELKAMYRNATEHLKVLEEVLELVKKLRLFYLLSQIVSFEYFNESRVEIYGSYSPLVKPTRTWTRTVVTNTTLRIPTPEPGFLVLDYNNTYRDCLNITAVNVYVAPGRYSARTTYYTAKTCSAEGVLLVPILPHQTTLELTILRTTTSRQVPSITLRFRYLTIVAQ